MYIVNVKCLMLYLAVAIQNEFNRFQQSRARGRGNQFVTKVFSKIFIENTINPIQLPSCYLIHCYVLLSMSSSYGISPNYFSNSQTKKICIKNFFRKGFPSPRTNRKLRAQEIIIMTWEWEWWEY